MKKIELYLQLDGVVKTIPHFTLTIPWPPSYAAYQKKHGLSQKGRKYRQKMEALYRLHRWRKHSVGPDVAVFMGLDLYPPDFRIQSLSEYLKAPMAELSYLGIISDLARIECLLVRQRSISPENPMIDVTVAIL